VKNVTSRKFATKLQRYYYIFDGIMRMLALILSFYITVLSIVPCSDNSPNNTIHSNIEVSTSKHDHNHSDHQDDCTPFCACTCCGSFVIEPINHFLIDNKIVISSDCLFCYSFNYVFDFYEVAWHPPSLS